MKRLLILWFVLICHQLWASTPPIEGLYVWNPGKYYWRLNSDKRRNTEPSQNVWDSLLVSPDSSYILKGSRFYDVGGKTIEGIIEGTWSNRGNYISLVPHNVNYSCVPNVTTDSIILVDLLEIAPATRDTLPIKGGLLYVYSEDGIITKYYTDSIGHVEIKYSPDILVVFIEGGFHPQIPFPKKGSSYNIIISKSYAIPNVDALFLKKVGEDMLSCFVYHDSLRFVSHYQKKHERGRVPNSESQNDKKRKKKK